MIGVMTSNFVLYHDLVNALHTRGLQFISLTFDTPIPADVDVIVTSPEEKGAVHFGTVVCPRREESMDELIDRALFIVQKRSPARKIIIGIDPGSTPGIAIFSDGVLFRRFTAKSPREAIDFILSFMKNFSGADVTIRVGHGARLVRNRMINALIGMCKRIEIADETSTNMPSTHDDMLAASAIALTPGRVISSELSMEPKDGEIKDMQRRSRIVSGDVTISKELAKKVLRGELEMEKAIDKQRGD